MKTYLPVEGMPENCANCKFTLQCENVYLTKNASTNIAEPNKFYRGKNCKLAQFPSYSEAIKIICRFGLGNAADLAEKLGFKEDK